MTHHLIIGNGVAGTTAAEYIRKYDQEASVTMVTDENLPFYYRIRLNEFLSGDITENDLVAKKETWYGDHKIDLKLGTRIKGANPEKRIVMTKVN